MDFQDFTFSPESGESVNGQDTSKKISEFSFAYDPQTNKFSVYKDGEFVTDVPIYTVQGANGNSAYEEWAQRLPKETREEDKSFAKFLSVFKGRDGKDAAEWTINEDGFWCCNGIPTLNRAVPPRGADGKSAYEIWAETQPADKRSTEDWLDFIHGKEGKKGKSAFEEWKSLSPEERKNATLSDFFNWIANQTEKKIDAKEGASWIPNIVDGKVIFVNNRTGATTDAFPIVGKDGKSFNPKIIDGKLTFVDGEGHEVTPRYEFRGKSAYEVWLEEPENKGKTKAQFFEFIKGEKGDNGADGIIREAKHSYLEIKDFTCPVQTIDTALIANLDNSAKSPDSVIEERMKEIEDKRAEGRTVYEGKQEKNSWFFNGRNIYKNWAGWFKEFTWWCAGADRPLLRMCPGDHSKYTGIGTVILFTALMAWFSSYIAMRLVFEVNENLSFCQLWSSGKNWAAIGFATFWAMMIFFLDRFITNTMYSDGKVSISKDEFVGGLPRILIAIFLGIVISAPLELKIFKQEIEENLKKELTNKIANETKESQRYKNAKEEYSKLTKEEEDLKQQYLKTLNTPNDSSYYVAKNITVRKGTKYDYVIDPITLERHLVENSLGTSVQQTKRYDRNLYYKALSRDSLAYENAKKRTILAQENLAKTESLLKDSLHKVYDKYVSEQGLYANLNAMHTIAMEDYEPWWGDDLNKNGILEYEEGNVWDAILHSWWYFLLFTPIGLIMLLFILIDISPVLYKMMLADGVYDNYLHQEKLLKQDKIRLSLARMLRKIDKSELKALSPFIMGKIYRKISKFSVSSDGTFNGKEKDYKSFIEWGENTDHLNDRIEEENRKVFEIVMEYKKRIILASYAAWYRDMRDAMIGSKDDKEGNRITPESYLHENPNIESESKKEDSPQKDPENDRRMNDDDSGSTNVEDEDTEKKEADGHQNNEEKPKGDNPDKDEYENII